MTEYGLLLDQNNNVVGSYTDVPCDFFNCYAKGCSIGAPDGCPEDTRVFLLPSGHTLMVGPSPIDPAKVAGGDSLSFDESTETIGISYVDADGNPQVLELTLEQIISTPHPVYEAGDNISITPGANPTDPILITAINTFGTVTPDDGSGISTVTDANGNAIDVCLNPIKSIEALDLDPLTNILSFSYTPQDGTAVPLSIDLTPLAIDIDQRLTNPSFNDPANPTILTWDIVDIDGSVVGTEQLDVTALISSPHPEYAAGTNITITGTGTTADPYVIEASGGTAPEIATNPDLPCNPTDNAKMVTPLAMDLWLDKNLEFDSATITGHTNTCRNTVQGSINSTAAANSGVRNSQTAEATGTFSSAESVANSQAEGAYSKVVASGNVKTTAANAFIAASSAGSEANGVGSSIISSSNTILNAVRAASLGVNGPSLVESDNSALVASRVCVIEANAPMAGMYSTTDSTIRNGATQAAIIGSERCEALDLSSIVMASINTINPTRFNVAGGYNLGGAPLSSNRTWELDGITGDINASGAITAGAVFPGFGEKAISDSVIPEGSFVRFEGLHKVRLAEVGEVAHGVTTKDLAICAGGGYDPDNAPWVLDELGNRTFETVEQPQADTIEITGYREEIEKIEAVVNGEKTVIEISTQVPIEEAKKYDGEPVFSQVPVRNPNYDPEKKLEINCVEMLGRNFARHDGTAKVGSFLVPAAGGVGTDSENGFEVLEVISDSLAFVFVK